MELFSTNKRCLIWVIIQNKYKKWDADETDLLRKNADKTDFQVVLTIKEIRFHPRFRFCESVSSASKKLFRHFHKVFIKQRNRFYSFQVIKNSKMFVWRVNRIRIQTKSH